MSTRDKLLALKNNLKIEAVTVEGMTIFVRTLTGRERDAFENSCFSGKGKYREMNTDNIRAKLLVRSICNGATDGSRVFSDDETDALGELPASVLDALFTVAQKLSGLGATEMDELASS